MSISSNINLRNISATDLQSNVANQVNDQIARARTRWAPSIAKNVADQVAPSTQRGTAYNNLSVRSNAYWDTNVKIRDISAQSHQNDKVSLLSTSRWRMTSNAKVW